LIRAGLGAARLACLIAAAATGCGSRVAYTPPQSAALAEPVVLRASYDDSWNAVIQTFFQRNISVKTLEKASGLVESDELRGEIGRDCDCGSWLGVPIAGYGAYGGDAYYRFRVLLERRGADSALSLRSTCRAKTDRIDGELACQMAAAKETELRDAIAERVHAASQTTRNDSALTDDSSPGRARRSSDRP
jgi:hypothetical protein